MYIYCLCEVANNAFAAKSQFEMIFLLKGKSTYIRLPIFHLGGS